MSTQPELQLKPDELAAKLLAYGEEERRRIARELHDDISQRLALLADDSDRLRRDLHVTDEANRLRLDNLVRQARALSDDLRHISHSLHPSMLDDLGLKAAIRSLTRHFSERTGMAARFKSSGEIPRDVPKEVGTALYRIAQEALRNAAKHAGETPVTVSLEAREGELILIVSDSGNGFIESANKIGLGLTSMRERAYLAGGVFEVVSAPDKGTTVKVRIPPPPHPCGGSTRARGLNGPA
jgi:signal transduction histidine kinase